MKQWIATLQTIKTWGKDALFPLFCVGCDKEGEWLCGWCIEHLDAELLLTCPGCNLPTRDGEPCRQCADEQVLTGFVAAGVYDAELPLARLITAYKYSYAEELSSALSAYLCNDDVLTQLYKWKISIVIPVPLHARRYAERGFNQAEPLANGVAHALVVPMVQALTRNKYTTAQARLSRTKRLSNVRGAFDVLNKEIVQKKHILLVDDVYSTGATMSECARTLLDAGAKQVYALTVARGK